MLRLLLTLLAFCASVTGVNARGVELVSLETRPDVVGVNLVPNGSFESSGPGGLPDRWKWDKRNTQATCVIDARDAADGRQCVKLTNPTPSMTGVYGELLVNWPASLKSGKTYTLSAWTKSHDPGFARLGGGSAWQYRVTLPATGGKWQRVSVTFTPTEATKEFEISLVTKGVTKGLWLDGVRLEEGSRATLDWSSAAVRVCPESRALEVLSDGEFAAPFAVCVPRAMTVELEAVVSGQKRPITSRVDLMPGVMQVMVKGSCDAADYTPRTVTLRLLEGAKEVASAQTAVRFHSAKYALARLDEIEARLPDLKRRLDGLKASGQDVSYPKVSYTVLENFAGYAREDATKGEVKRAVMQVRDLESIERSLNKEIADALSGKRRLPAVPRWTGASRPVLKGSSFIAPTATPGKPGVESRPVFFTGYGHFAQVQADIEKFPSYGVNIIQIEVGPWSILPEEGVVDEKPIRDLLNVLDRAQKAGVSVNVLLSPHYMPGWLLAKHPALRKRREYFIPYCVHAAETQDLLERFISILIPPIKDHPALHSICLSNEPRNAEEPCEPGAREWHEWLKSRHGEIKVLNDRWGASYASIDEVPLPNPFDESSKEPLGRWVDYVRWNQEFHARWHAMLADAVHAAAPDLPVHAKVQSSTFWNPYEAYLGNEPYLMGQVCDINGNDGVNVYSFGEDTFAQSWLSNCLTYDLQRSMRDAPVFNSENHLITDRDTRFIPEQHVRCALWQQAIHGQSATTIWVWERTFDKGSDFAGSIMHRPACARAVGVVSHDLNRAAAEVTALQQAPPQVLILNSTSEMVSDTEGCFRRLTRLYMSLAMCGVKIGFVTERQLEDGMIPEAAVLCIPAARHITDAALETLRRFRGRVLTLEKDALACNEFGKPRSERMAMELLPYDQDSTDMRQLSALLTARLTSWGVRPPVEVVDRSGKPVWGVQWRATETADGVVVNLCNCLDMPVSLRLSRDGKGVVATDVLSGETVRGLVTLQPLEVRLLKVK